MIEGTKFPAAWKDFSLNRFGLMRDEEIALLAQAGHRSAAEFLIARYRPLVEAKARLYFVIGADRDDVVQEGMIGLCKAIRDFRSDRLNQFRTFAELCVTRQIITAVKSATRQKHAPLNAYVSLNNSVDTDLHDSLSTEALAPADAVPHIPHDLRLLVQHALSDLENGVLTGYLDGMSYREMSRKLCCHTKTVDNALQRVKKKIGGILGHQAE
jgi:RNA polymerase sporulation-specific sigma factor